MFYIYSNPQSRFLAVTQDLWITMTLTKLLSSKMSLNVCRPPKGFKLLSNEECVFWGIVDLKEVKQEHQLPVLIDINSGIEYKGILLDLPENLLIEYQNFILKCYNILYAAWLTDTYLNSSNNKFFEPFFDIATSPEMVYDDSGVPNGFLNTVYQIIYFSTSIEEVEEKINIMFHDKKTSRPWTLELYKKTFHKNFL